jgi:catechol 2,3-dioxygenase
MDVDAVRHHYEDVLGLIPTHQDASSNVYWKGWDERDKYSVVVSQADRAGMNHVAYKVEHNADLDEFQTRIADYRIDVEEVPPGHLECCGCALRFQLSSQHQMYLDTETECVGKAVGTTNPAPWPDGLKGCGAHWLDHVLLMGELNPEQGIDKVAESTAFVQEVLDVRLVEQVMVGPDQSIQAATGLARTTTPHASPLSVGHIWGFTIAPSFLTNGGMCSRPPM